MNIIDLLNEDHVEFRSILDGYASDPQGSLDHLKRDIHFHTKLEEEILYPAMEMHEPEKVQHAEEEHDKADQLLAELASDPTNSTVFYRLRDALLHHVEEEEEDFFPRTAEALGNEALAEMGKRARERKEELKEEWGNDA